MREKLRQFMIGRYGTDGLNQFLSIASLVLLLIAIISRVSLFTYLGAALLIFCYYRTFSRNISKRTEENYKFYTLKDRVDNKFKAGRSSGPTARSTTTTAAPSAARSCACPAAAAASRSPAPAAAPSSSRRAEPCSDMLSRISHAQPGGTGAVPLGLLRALPPYRRAARHPGAADPEL